MDSISIRADLLQQVNTDQHFQLWLELSLGHIHQSCDNRAAELRTGVQREHSENMPVLMRECAVGPRERRPNVSELIYFCRKRVQPALLAVQLVHQLTEPHVRPSSSSLRHDAKRKWEKSAQHSHLLG